MSLTPEAFEVIDAIHEHWSMAGVDGADQMRAELADRVEHALSNGETIDDVTGHDLRVFADAWAAERTGEPEGTSWVALAALVARSIVGVTSALVLFETLGRRSLSVVIETGNIGLFSTLLVAMTLLQRSRLTNRPRPTDRVRWFILNLVRALVAVSPVGLAVRLWEPPALDVPVPLTLVALLPLTLLVHEVIETLKSRDGPPLRAMFGLAADEGRAGLRSRVQHPVAPEDRPPPPPRHAR